MKRTLILTRTLFILTVCMIVSLNSWTLQVKAEDESQGSTGTLRESKQLSQQFHTPYNIKIALRNPLLMSQIRDKRTFRLLNASTGQEISNYYASEGGLPINETAPTEEQLYKTSIVWGDFSGYQDYVIEIRFPRSAGSAVDVETIAVSKLKDETSEYTFRLLSEATDLRIEPILGEEANGLGVKYTLVFTPIYKFDVTPNDDGTFTPKIYSARFETKGELSTDEDDEDFQNNLTVGMALSYRREPSLQLDVLNPETGKAEQRAFAYPMGLEFKPVELEASQDLESVDYTFKALAYAAVPYSDLPVLWWHGINKVGVPFVPLVVTAGYSYIAQLEDSGTRREFRDTEHRIDLEALYDIPLLRSLDLRSQWRGFVDLSKGDFVDYIDVGLIYYLDEARTMGMTLSYQNGALPPEFEDTSAVRFGFSMDLPGR